MSMGLRRGLADRMCRVLQATLPPNLKSWGWAIRCEAASIPDDTKALLFALGSLCGLMPRAIASRLPRPFASPIGDDTALAERSTAMTIYVAKMRPRAIGIACAVGAVLAGLVYMMLAGAPTRYLGINVGALAVGLTMLTLLDRTVATRLRWTTGALVAMAGALLATACFGAEVDGASRWVVLGGLVMQPSLILLPVMIVAFSQTRDTVATAGIVVAAAAMALQPDRAMAGMLVLGLAAVAVARRDRHVAVALAAGIIGFAAALTRADSLPAVPYVDRILYSSFDVHIGAGLAVIVGSALLPIPAIVYWNRDADNRATYAAFGAVWVAAIMAAAIGNYPTPIVGYGGSAIIGYALSLVALPKRTMVRARAASRGSGETSKVLPDRNLFAGLRGTLRPLTIPATRCR